MFNAPYWCAFARLEKTGAAFVNRLYSRFGSAADAWNASRLDLSDVQGITQTQIDNFLEEKKKINPDWSYEYIQKRGIDFIHPEDRRYPYLLRFIDRPPIGLFMKGDITLCNPDRTLAAVGSRRAGEYAKTSLAKIISEFKGTDICIVSGLAEGIDTAAHKAAVNNDLMTIAVIGGGFDHLYPKSNTKLFNDIIDGHGAVLTEYWCSMPALSRHFPVRNRIVSGLSKGVLIAEAALKSGAMITANLALEQGKELMCMPGLISNPNTQGIYKLLKEGASLITCAQDIMDAMNWQFVKEGAVEKNDENIYTEDEKQVIDIIKKDVLSFDGILEKTKLSINDLMVILTKLELTGVIAQVSGERYVFCH